MVISGGYVDDKIVTARKLLREGKTMKEIGKVIGLSKDGTRHYLQRMGVPIPRQSYGQKS